MYFKLKTFFKEIQDQKLSKEKRQETMRWETTDENEMKWNETKTQRQQQKKTETVHVHTHFN